MANEKQITRVRDTILGRLTGVLQLIKTKDVGFDANKIETLMIDVETEVSGQADDLIKEANKPKKPRSAKKILEAIDDLGKITPELLKEIKTSLEVKDKGKSASRKAFSQS